MRVQRKDETNRYLYEKLESLHPERRSSKEFATGGLIRTFFLHSGKLNLEVELDGKKEMNLIDGGQGFIIGPQIKKYTLSSDGDFFGVQTTSYIGNEKTIIKIIDMGNEKLEVPLNKYEIITNPKRINKPWGHELWISWFRDYHVLKQIGMTAGNMSSLQLHRDKLETNYLVEGEADVIDGYPMDLSLGEEKMRESVRDVDWKNYTERKKSGMYWTSKPGIVHRVISKTDYIAYETSTPELDDVIRLSDTSGRQSGRIISEHK